MSNVQGPTSGVDDVAFNFERADRGHSTLDIRQTETDIGLNVLDLRKSYTSPSGDRIEILRSVSLSVSPGESVAIIGPSGTGKSTLLNLLGGLDSADHGAISVGPFSITSASAAALAQFRNQNLGFIFQFHHLMLDLTAAENVGLPLMIRRVMRTTALSSARDMLEQSGLRDRCDHLASHLSGGEQQRVAVCRALITSPSVVLADEPTGNLDTVNSDIVARSLTDYARKSGKVVVIATHNQKLAGLCDRTLQLQDGRLSS